MADIDKVLDQLNKLTVLEMAELVKKAEEEWGVSAAAPVAGVLTALVVMLCHGRSPPVV